MIRIPSAVGLAVLATAAPTGAAPLPSSHYTSYASVTCSRAEPGALTCIKAVLVPVPDKRLLTTTHVSCYVGLRPQTGYLEVAYLDGGSPRMLLTPTVTGRDSERGVSLTLSGQGSIPIPFGPVPTFTIKARAATVATAYCTLSGTLAPM